MGHEAGGATVRTIEYRERHRDGRWLWIQGRVTTVEWSSDGTPARIVGTDTDVTDLKNAEEKLQFANILLNIQMETSPDGILVVDAGARIISYNRRFADMWGVPLELLDAKDDEPILAKVTSLVKDPTAFVARVRYLYEHPEERGHDEVETRDGRWLDRHTGVLHTAAGEYLGRVWFFRDITGRKESEELILKTARQDGLTGIANRAVFLEEVHRAIVTVRRGAAGFAVLYLDLDQFKDVNDTLGHPAGDELLKAVVKRLQANIRDADVVARFGGDEFAIMMAGIGAPSDAAGLADKIIAAMNGPFLIRNNAIRSTVSIGIALSEPDRLDAETMLARADLALYRAKAEGPGVHRFFTEAMESEVRTRVRLASELREAIASDQLFLVYQPQVAMETGQITGVEALVRWRHPTRGVLGPNLFIAAAEKSGPIAGLGHWVLREACRQSKVWLDAGILLKATAVNLSGVQFKRAFRAGSGHPRRPRRNLPAAVQT
jgi:diguanylate cyclase (GGDEF)-like protein/PAS domain S-box-containing protein